jgi:hypothetical protein
MQVSNSTGRNTDYRVGASGGTNRMTADTDSSLVNGQLAPGDSAFYDRSGSCTVDFVMDGTVVASGSFSDDPGQVTLVEQDGRYLIQTEDLVASASSPGLR